jgi:hypothetical protein
VIWDLESTLAVVKKIMRHAKCYAELVSAPNKIKKL